MAGLRKKSFYLYDKELRLLDKELEVLGFKGRGSLADFLRKVIEPETQLVFISSSGSVKVRIENGKL